MEQEVEQRVNSGRPEGARIGALGVGPQRTKVEDGKRSQGKNFGETGTQPREKLPKSRSRHRRAEPPRCTPPTSMHRFGTPATRYRVPKGSTASRVPDRVRHRGSRSAKMKNFPEVAGGGRRVEGRDHKPQVGGWN